METDDRIELQSRDTTSQPSSTKLGMPAPEFLLRQARARSIGLRVVVSEDGTLTGKGGLR